MNPVRILAAATAMECSFAAAVLAAAGLGGARNEWLDVINVFAPMILAAAVLGAVLALVSMDRGAARWVTLALATAAGLYALAMMGPELARLSTPHAQGGRPLRILQLNVWHDNLTPAPAADALIARGADVIVLQEANGEIVNALPMIHARYPYLTDCVASELLIFSRTPFTAKGCSGGASDPTHVSAAWIRTTAPDGRPLTVVTTHFAWPVPPGRQSIERQGLAALLRRLPTGDLVLAGDFNTTPWSFSMRRQDAWFKPLTRRTIAWFSWPALVKVVRWPWAVPVLPIDQLYAGPNWKLARLTRLRIPGSVHFATEAVLVRGN